MIFDTTTKHTRELEGNESIILCEICGHEIEGKIFYLDNDVACCDGCYDDAVAEAKEKG